MLFAAVKAGWYLGLDSELMLHAACEKFIRRFRAVEEHADRPMKEMALDELNALWQKAKEEEHQK